MRGVNLLAGKSRFPAFFSFLFCVGGRISAEMLTALNYVQNIYSLIIFYTDASCLNNGEQINIYGYFFSLFRSSDDLIRQNRNK